MILLTPMMDRRQGDRRETKPRFYTVLERPPENENARIIAGVSGTDASRNYCTVATGTLGAAPLLSGS